jgi:hypothetical protein
MNPDDLDAAAEGAIRLGRARGADGRRWELIGRIEPVAGCAADAPGGYRLSLVARPMAAGSEAETVRVTATTVHPTWPAAREALRALAAAVAADWAARAADRAEGGGIGGARSAPDRHLPPGGQSMG